MNLRETIKKTEREKKAIGHFNIASLEQLEGIARAAQKLHSPVIIGVSEGEREYLGVHRVRDLVAGYNASSGERDGFWMFINADHTHALEKVGEAARAGYHAVLFDGGKLSLSKNTENTKKAVALAKSFNPNVLVEGEMGYIGSGSELLDSIPDGAAVDTENFTKPEEAAKFVEETGVDLLGPAVGNIHGMLKGVKNPRLDIERIRAIREMSGVPLVLHGGSGISDEDFISAIDAGIAIIHISTEIRAAWREGLEKSLKAHPHEVAPYKVMPEVIASIEKVVTERLKLFNKL